MFVLRSILLATCLSVALAQVDIPGQCPDWKPMPNFDINKYAGIWFDIYGYPFFPQTQRKCEFGEVKYYGNDNVTLTSNFVTLTTPAIPIAQTRQGKVIAPGQFAFDFFGTGLDVPNYNVLATDYKFYASLYACSNLNSTHYTANAFVMGGAREISQANIDQGFAKFKEFNIPLEYFKKNDQTNCPNVVRKNN